MVNTVFKGGLAEIRLDITCELSAGRQFTCNIKHYFPQNWEVWREHDTESGFIGTMAGSEARAGIDFKVMGTVLLLELIWQESKLYS